MPLRSLFFGTPAFAVPCLDALRQVSQIVGVVCQPDKPVGRGRAVAAPAVKVHAEALGIHVHQPTKLRTGEFASWMREASVDVALVVAYGRILPEDVLVAPRLGCVNVHASLLPKYRGAAPITWAIVRGETETGITLMKMDAGMDTGPMLEQWSTPIVEDETAGELGARLSLLGAEAVRTGLPRYVAGEYEPQVQDETRATLAPLLTKSMGLIDWKVTASQVHNHVRGMNPWPGAFTVLNGKTVKIHGTVLTHGTREGAAPGEVIFADKHQLLVACGQNAVDILSLQLEGKRAVRGVDWVIGRGVKEGDILG